MTLTAAMCSLVVTSCIDNNHVWVCVCGHVYVSICVCECAYVCAWSMHVLSMIGLTSVHYFLTPHWQNEVNSSPQISMRNSITRILSTVILAVLRASGHPSSLNWILLTLIAKIPKVKKSSSLPLNY